MKHGSGQTRWRWFLLLSAVAIVCFCGAVYQSQCFAALSGSVLLRYREPSLMIEAVEGALENAPAHGTVLDATLWSEYESQPVSNEWDREARLRVLLAYGDTKRAYPVNCKEGVHPARGDAEGCAVDRAAAYALFGSRDVLGSALTWQGERYVVRGVLEGMRGIVLVQAGEKDTRAFANLALAVSPDVNGREAAESFSLMNGFGIPDAIQDAPFCVQFADALALLPAWVVAAALIINMISRTVGLRTNPVLCLGAAAITAAAAALMLYASQFSPPFPERYIPTRWSDFSFWKGLAAQWKIHAGQLRSVDPLIADGMRGDAVIGCGILSAAAAACFAGAMALRPAFSLCRWMFAEFVGIGVTFLAMAAFSAMGKPVEPPRALWLTWVLYLMLAPFLSEAYRDPWGEINRDTIAL